MLKFQRNYKIVFEIGERPNLNTYIPQEYVEVAYPFTLRLNVDSGIDFSQVSRGNFQLLNLSPTTQAKLWKDYYNQTKYITMYLYAGYQDVMPLILKADISQCYSYRDGGNVDFITDFQASDGGYLFQYGVSNSTFAKGTEFENLLAGLLEDNPLYKVGYISPEIQPLRTDKTFIGQTMDLLGNEYGGYNFFIERGELNIIGQNEVVPGDIMVLTSESGLLGTPKRAQQFLEARMIFEPQIRLAQAIELISDTAPFMNNIYKVVGISHQGVISPRESGNLITTVTLFLGDKPFVELKKAAPTTYGGQPTTGPWIKPVKGRVSSPYGWRIHPTKKVKKFHGGMDIAAPLNTPVVAPANGKVKLVGYKGENGNLIIIDHGTINGKKVESYYLHLNKFLVKYGQTVYQGQQIGLVGATGRMANGKPVSTGYHLDFRIKENGTAVNPTVYIGNY